MMNNKNVCDCSYCRLEESGTIDGLKDIARYSIYIAEGLKLMEACEMTEEDLDNIQELLSILEDIDDVDTKDATDIYGTIVDILFGSDDEEDTEFEKEEDLITGLYNVINDFLDYESEEEKELFSEISESRRRDIRREIVSEVLENILNDL